MAFTQAPSGDTYSQVNLPVVYTVDKRPYTTDNIILPDASLTNLIAVKSRVDQNSMEAVTRNSIQGVVVDANNSSDVRGCYVWEKSAGVVYYFFVAGTSVYTSTSGDLGSWTAVTTLTGSDPTLPVGFTEFIDGTNGKKLVLVDGVNGFVFTSNAAGTKITDVDFPTPHVPNPIFIDGYLFLAKADTGDIYNSNLNDPSLWTAGDFISSELYPDNIVALAKINNYLLAIGTQGCEFFYDAANPNGTPLARYDGGSLPFGTLIPRSICVNKNTLVLLANNNDGTSVFKIIEDFKARDLDSSFLVEYINYNFTYGSSGPSQVRTCFIRQFGDLHYIFNVASLNPNAPTFVYNLTTNTWSIFTVEGLTSGFCVWYSSASPSGQLVNYVAGTKKGTTLPNVGFFGVMREGFVPPFTSGALDQFNHPVLGLVTFPISTEIKTTNESYGTLNTKTMSRFGVQLQISNHTTTVDPTASLSVSWTDDDYNSYSTVRSLPIAPQVNFPFLTQLGQFRQRAFKMQYSGVYFIRYRSLEVDINKGQQ